MEKILIVDGNALLHRGFYAIPPLRTSTGELVNAVYGFTSMLLNTLISEEPAYCVLTFDMKGATFRSEEFTEYKATRKKAPDELYAQLPRIKNICNTFEIPIFEKAGFEADDLIGTIASKVKKMDKYPVILTGDLDILQLVDDKTRVLIPQNGFKMPKKYDSAAVIEKMGIAPNQVIDYKALRGDVSDNIPGVAGIGQKTAVKLLTKYGTLECVYKNIGEITGSIHEKLKNSKEMAFLSQKLATIILDVDIDFDIENCHTHKFDKDKLTSLFTELQFNSLVRKLNGLKSQAEVEKDQMQQTLF